MFLIWFATSWVIWKERNHRIFRYKENTTLQLLENIKHLSFCEIVLSPTTFSKMVSELVEFKGHLPIHAPSPKSAAGRDGGVLGKTHVPNRIDKTLGNSLYRGGNPHLMNRFLRMS